MMLARKTFSIANLVIGWFLLFTVLETVVDGASTARLKRSITSTRLRFGKIHTNQIVEVDTDVTADIYYVRVGAFVADGDHMEPRDAAEIVVEGHNDKGQFLGYVSSITGSDGIACVPVWCLSTATIQASFAEIPLIPDTKSLLSLPKYFRAAVINRGNISAIKSRVVPDSKVGPVFARESQCKEADGNVVRQFLFISHTSRVALHQGEGLREITSYPPGHSLSWYPDEKGRIDPAPEICLLKVRVRGNRKVSLMVESYTGDETFRYGYVIKSPDQTMEEKGLWADCFEFRCNSAFAGPGRTNRTYVIVSLLTSYCYYVEFSAEMSKSQKWHIPWDHFDANIQGLYVPDREQLKEDSGFYIGETDVAKRRCNGGEGGHVSARGYAMEFYEGEECPSLNTGNIPGLEK